MAYAAGWCGVTPDGTVSVFVDGFDGPDALAFDSSGNLFVANSWNNTVSEVTPSGTVSTLVPSTAGLDFPSALAFDSSGNLYIANANNNTVSELTPAGTVSTFIPATAGLDYPSALAFDSSGNLYVANEYSNTVSEVTPGGAFSTSVPASAGLFRPDSLAFDIDGNLSVLNEGNNTLYSVVFASPTFAVSPADAAKLSAIGHDPECRWYFFGHRRRAAFAQPNDLHRDRNGCPWRLELRSDRPHCEPATGHLKRGEHYIYRWHGRYFLGHSHGVPDSDPE